MRRAIPVVLALIAAVPLTAQVVVSPNLERGISPGKAFDVGDIDDVNLFNGNLNVSIPLGQTYQVNGTLSYGLRLNYSGNAWEFATRQTYVTESGICASPCRILKTYTWAFPAAANAGWGWNVSLGGLTYEAGNWRYDSPDGGRHQFYQSLHPTDCAPGSCPAGVFYTRDGTYLRLTQTSTGFKLEFPDGTYQLYTSIGTNGTQLTSINDRFGNTLTISYNDSAIPDAGYGGDTWHLHDSVGRDQYVYFKPVASYEEGNGSGANAATPVPHQAVAEVWLKAFDGGTLKYKFHYVGESNGTWATLNRPCGGDPDPALSEQTNATLLSSVEIRDASGLLTSYSMQHEAPGPDCSYTGSTSGALTQLQLPTGAIIHWNYDTYSFPAVYNDSVDSLLQFTPGVVERTVADGSGVFSKTTYDPEKNLTDQPWREDTTTVTTYDVTKDASRPIVRTITHFNVCHVISSVANEPGGATCDNDRVAEYGLPVSPITSDSSGRRLSSETLEPHTDGTWSTRKATYLRYECDTANSVPYDTNRRVISERTAYTDDTAVADTNYDQFDGVGHYRQIQMTGFTAGNSHTQFTNYNPDRGTYSGSGVTIPGTFTPLPTTSPWILNTYTYTTATEASGGSPVAMTQYCFDATSGFLTRRRAITADVTNTASPTLAASDTLAVFTNDGSGNVGTEEYYGGDEKTAPVSSDCSASITGSSSYGIHHDYDHGSLKISRYEDATGSALSFKTVDRSIDANTGFAKYQCEAASATVDCDSTDGLRTAFLFDVLGRLTYVKRPQGAWTHYAYQFAPPKVDQYDNPNGQTTESTNILAHIVMTFDVLGRPVTELRDLPANVITQKKTTYNALGWKTSESEWAVSPHLATTFTYDALGRATNVAAPDGSHVSMSYTGASSMQRTVSVMTANASPPGTAVTTTEFYDRQGRLLQIQEPAPGTLTEYEYDYAGRLISVCQNKNGTACGQPRTFTYDNRGFLLSEKHPEKGQFGNGTTFYDQHDARGHVLRRHDGSANGPFDLTFAYDRAERPVSISETRMMNGFNRTLKSYTYGTSNGTNDYRNGRITQAVRQNWADVPGSGTFNLQVTEDYTYGETDGAVSARTTSQYDCIVDSTHTCQFIAGTPKRRFSQQFTYDGLGHTKTLTYPDCSYECGSPSIAPPTVTYTYDHGLLMSVAAPFDPQTPQPQNSTLTYSENGMVHVVTHSNGVTDTIEPDPGMQRPLSISTANALDSATCTAPTISSQPAATTILSGHTATLTVTASGDSAQSLTYQWYIGTSGDTSQPTVSNASSITVSPTATTSYWVRVQNGCTAPNSVSSSTATVTVCTTPSITTQPANVTITSGTEATLTVGASGSSLTYQWYVRTGTTDTAIPGATGSSTTVQPSQTSIYWVQVTGCQNQTASSSLATVTVASPPAAPTSITATFDPSTFNSQPTINVVWTGGTAGAGIDHYQLERTFNGGAYTTIASVYPPATSYADGPLTQGVAYVYRVRTVDANRVVSAPSLPDAAGIIILNNDPASTSPPTFIRGSDVGQLRQAIDMLRHAAGLGLVWALYGPETGAIQAQTFLDMRKALDEARSALGLPGIAYARDPLLAGASPVLATDINEIRIGVK